MKLARKYTSFRDGSRQLFMNVMGGWLDKTNREFKMTREEYLELGADLHVKKALFELGSVREVDGNEFGIRSPNFAATNVRLISRKMI